MEIKDILDSLANGVDPTTGEIFDKSVFEQKDIREAFDRLKVAFKKAGKKSKYKARCEQYPEHIILIKAGYFYSAFYQSAEILGQVMGYKVVYMYDGEVAYTGGPDLCIIADGLRAAGLSYIAFNGDEIEDRYDGKNPFI